MKAFALDLWHDLREKRLWPVAVLLLAGLVAVPVLLAKPAEDPGPPPAVETPAAAEKKEDEGQLAQVTLESTEVDASGSTLGVFDPSNPFKPPKKVIEAAKDDTGSGSEAGPADQTAGDDAASGSGSGGGSDDAGSTGGGSTPPSSGGGTTPDNGGKPTTTVYKYVVDVTFTANGRTRRIKGMERLDMLPNQSSGLLIAMGVTADGGNAVFLVDASLKAAGEGTCKPSAKQCGLVYIGPGSEHAFTQEDGDSYTLRIDEIRKVEVKPGAARAKAGKAEGARANAAVGSPRRFEPLMLADIVVVASDRLEDSNSNSDRR
jgi:hypothetical protein